MKALPIIAAAFTGFLITSCRFGNHIENPANPDQLSGYYNSAPQALTFYTVVSGTEHATDSNPSTRTPPEIAEVMTDPVIFLNYQPADRIGVFASSTGKGDLLGIFYGADQKTLEVQYSNDAVAWPGAPTCIRHAGTAGAGKIVKETPITAGKFTISGRAQVEWTKSYSFTGDCAAAFQQMASCYSDAALCPGTSASDRTGYKDFIRSFFNPYIDAGAMSASDIPNTTAVGYTVRYE